MVPVEQPQTTGVVDFLDLGSFKEVILVQGSANADLSDEFMVYESDGDGDTVILHVPFTLETKLRSWLL